MTGDVQVPDGGGDPADFGGVHTPGMSDDERRLDEVWRAFGCASNPDAFKASVRERMWARVCEMARAAEARDTRLDRENRDLRAALASQPAPLDVAVAAAGPWSCCEHCAEDDVHDVDRNGHDIPCQTCVYAEVIRRASQPAPTVTAEAIEAACEVMHDAYERAAVGAGWETQTASRKPWEEVPNANKATMRSAVKALLETLPHLTPAQSGDGVAEVRPEGAPLTPELGQTIAEYWEAKVGEAVARERERIATALEVERDRPWSIAETMNTSIYGALDIAVHIARTTTEEADHG